MAPSVTAVRWSFGATYATYFAFVWRNARRLGVPSGALDDVVQEVFVVVHRRLDEVADRPELRGFLFAVLFGVVANQRRSERRRGVDRRELDPGELALASESGPEEQAARAEAARALFEILSELDEDKRQVFVLAELEELPVPEIAEATATNVNTVYARLRAARREFNAAVARFRARDGWRMR